MIELWKNDKPYFVKKCASVALIIFGILFVLMNTDVYYSNYKDSVKITGESLENPFIVSFEGDKVFEQQFRGWNGTLTKVILRFDNQGNQSAEGMVTLNILDESGNVIQSMQKEISQIRTTKKTGFKFLEPSQLSENQWYTLQMVVEGARNPQGFGVFTYAEKGELFGQLKEDGKDVDNRLGASFSYDYYNMGAIRHMFTFFAMALVFIFIPFSKLDGLVEKKWNKQIDTNKIVSRLFFVATPILCFMIADRFNGFTIMKILSRMKHIEFVFNMLIYIVVWLIVYVIINRVQYTSMIVLFLAFAASIANYYVWIFRGCPILATDLQSAKTAMNVAANFSYSLDMTGVWGVVYIVTFLSMLLSLKGYKGLSLKKRAIVLAVCIIGIFTFNVVFFGSDIVQKSGVKAEVWHPQTKYAKNGTALSFVLSWTYTKVDKPSGYSVEKVAEIIEGYESDTASLGDARNNKLPNVIAIMNESLGDLSYNSNIQFSEDYLPFIHGLTENTVKGKLYVSIQGANTANSEFEFLTGNSMMFLPYRCIPYNLYIKDITPSMAQNMKAQGYAGMDACHPYLASGWNRSNVYPLLGFDQFCPDEYYYASGNDSLVRNYISDKADFDQIIDDYETARKQSDIPFYLFNVTMQNHGGYDGKRGSVDTKITIEDPDLEYDEAEQFINLAKMSDDAFKDLVEYFEGVDEPTIIVMFGDHQPPITNDFYAAQFGKNVNNLSVEQQATWYSTPYLIWANYDIEEAELDMSSNYLSSYVMQMAGLKLTGYNKYLLELQKTLPVISAVCYMDAEGNIYANDEDSQYSDLLKEYQMVQYNQLFDLENRYNDFFFLREQ